MTKRVMTSSCDRTEIRISRRTCLPSSKHRNYIYFKSTRFCKVRIYSDL